ncbi:MAG TPA: DUF456 family protein [Gemmatimonadota bacterium]|nr:DUF456 family protein [Gemmatimonadota bacterium]
MPVIAGIEGLLALAVVGMIVALVVIPLGLPGLWIMIGILAAATFADEVSPIVLVLLVVVALLAELAEWVIVARTSARWGGSRKAFWGAIAGGLVGILVGLPIPLPILGPLAAGLLGTFAGAAAVTLWETRALRSAGRVGCGAVLGRAFAAATKTAAGVVILVTGVAALILR